VKQFADVAAGSELSVGLTKSPPRYLAVVEESEKLSGVVMLSCITF
jgi:hypothetical protein